MRITSKHDTKKCEWVALYHEVASLTPDNDEFREEHGRIKQVLEIVKGMKRSELNEFADQLASKVEYQRFYRDGRWLDSPEQYNMKTQKMIDSIYEELLVYRLGQSVRKSLKRR